MHEEYLDMSRGGDVILEITISKKEEAIIYALNDHGVDSLSEHDKIILHDLANTLTLAFDDLDDD